MVDMNSAKKALLAAKALIEAEIESGKGAARQERRQLRLVRVESALWRIEKGNYGLCVRCQEAINPGRLVAVPEALLCLKCAGEPPGR